MVSKGLACCCHGVRCCQTLALNQAVSTKPYFLHDHTNPQLILATEIFYGFYGCKTHIYFPKTQAIGEWRVTSSNQHVFRKGNVQSSDPLCPDCGETNTVQHHCFVNNRLVLFPCGWNEHQNSWTEKERFSGYQSDNLGPVPYDSVLFALRSPWKPPPGTIPSSRVTPGYPLLSQS